MTPAALLLVAIGGLFVSGLPAVFVPTRRGRLAASGLFIASALATLVAAAFALADGGLLELSWTLPFGRFAIAVDALSAWFLVPVCVVPALAIAYGHGYMEAHPDAWPPTAATRVRVLYGVLTASLALLLVARDGILFLVAWEGMALATFFLVTTDDRDAAARRAGWVYLVATHVGTLALFAFFALLALDRGDTDLSPLTSAAHGDALVFLALVGFGLKAGLALLHVWLPPAHAAAPSHVSAALSGVVTKMGIYGLVRAFALLPAGASFAWGNALIIIGGVSAIGGILFAIAQSDLKRLLAYSTIENIGVITIGVGLALVGRASGDTTLVALGLGGALLHTLGHALFKPLLFLAAGSAIHAAGTRQLDRMGGLLRALPFTGAAFAFGAVAICALPPLAGFASELCIYLAAFRVVTHDGPAVAALAAPILGLTGALALACFVRAFGAVFLGEPRVPHHAHDAHEAPRSMRAPMAVLAIAVAALGIAPWAIAPFVDRAVAAVVSGAPALASVAPLGALTAIGAALVAAAALLFVLLRRRLRRTAWRDRPTWDCGYARPTARMQYTASSFGAPLVRMFGAIVRPDDRRSPIEGPFPRPARFERDVPDPVLDRLVAPAGAWTSQRLRWLRILQQGRVHAYLLYVLLGLLGLMLGLAW